ncbi:hypothetical protein YDYSY3_08730 [Paenibacillus chitinolyticus]|uniref:helix-turn-helix transcriptional regulator n=1 Tax=Paenibacillus chitinolyticus TaxID=79263 RepID=UPI0026E4E85E|nr:LuxR C-terminal-related transcriptional regulator [Paenibacillus chitinolyticus]GKS09873.1 hypothetical protein YDYSY3_08730 [Paenibacillus chitinolyticus]
MNLFDPSESVQHTWYCLADICPIKARKWMESFDVRGICSDTIRLNDRLSSPDIEHLTQRYEWLISIAREELAALNIAIFVPHVFVISDPYGIAIELIGKEDTIVGLELINFGVGTSFAIESTGFNAISLAMKLESTTVVQGKEHSLDLFQNWSCICVPIRLNGAVYGYVDFSFNTNMDVTFAVTLIEKTVCLIEKKLERKNPEYKLEKMEKLFEQFGLTKREKEIACGWLQNKSVMDMANVLGITEGTIRNMLKKVYAKTGVCNKGDFFRKFLS